MGLRALVEVKGRAFRPRLMFAGEGKQAGSFPPWLGAHLGSTLSEPVCFVGLPAASAYSAMQLRGIIASNISRHGPSLFLRQHITSYCRKKLAYLRLRQPKRVHK